MYFCIFIFLESKKHRFSLHLIIPQFFSKRILITWNLWQHGYFSREIAAQFCKYVMFGNGFKLRLVGKAFYAITDIFAKNGEKHQHRKISWYLIIIVNTGKKVTNIHKNDWIYRHSINCLFVWVYCSVWFQFRAKSVNISP